MTEAVDSELVRAAQAGDVAALGSLLERYRAQMMAVAVSLLGHHPDTEDVVQDACIQALRRIGDVRDPDAVRGWLIAIVANGCRAWLRRTTLETVPLAPVQEGSALDSAEQILERNAVRDWVRIALDGLPTPLRTVVLLRYFSDASSYRTIAELCDVPVGTVRSRLHSARAQLAEQLLATAATAHRPETTPRRFAEELALRWAHFRPPATPATSPTVTRQTFASPSPTASNNVGATASPPCSPPTSTTGCAPSPSGSPPEPTSTVVELRLNNPTDHPLHCPPGLTQLHFHDGRRILRIASHYAPDPRAIHRARVGRHRPGPSTHRPRRK